RASPRPPGLIRRRAYSPSAAASSQSPEPGNVRSPAGPDSSLHVALDPLSPRPRRPDEAGGMDGRTRGMSDAFANPDQRRPARGRPAIVRAELTGGHFQGTACGKAVHVWRRAPTYL